MTANFQPIPHLAFLANDPDLLLGILFGSCASHQHRFDSDIDVAVFPTKPMDGPKRQQIADQIASATGRPVDLIDLSTADGAILRQILTTGVLLFSKKPGILGLLSQRLLAWQEDFEPQLNKLLDARIRRFTAPLHGQ